METLKAKGAPIDILPSAIEGVITNALSMLKGRKLVEAQENLIRPKEASLVLLEYYANSIKQWQ